MRVPLLAPEFATAEASFRLGEWLVEVGESVLQGECVVELICPGMVVDLAVPESGVVVALLRQPDQAVIAGDILGWIQTQA